MILIEQTFECYFCKEEFKAFIPNGINITKGNRIITIPMCEKCKKNTRHTFIKFEDIESRFSKKKQK